MASTSTKLTLLKLSIAVILASLFCVWILKPTQLWKRSWHKAEDWADSTFIREPGLNVIVFCFPVLAVAALGYIYLHLCEKEGRIRNKRPLIANFSNPIFANSPVGIVSSSELIAAALFIVFLAWTYYSNVASDLKMMTPSKSLPQNMWVTRFTLNIKDTLFFFIVRVACSILCMSNLFQFRWQLKMMSIGVRFGSLSEACLALLFLPVLRGMALFAMCGIQFEASIRYHVWLGNAIMFFSILHGSTIMCVWGSKNSFWMEITRWQRTGRVYLAGAITLVVGLIIWITSLPQLRRKNFKFFYFSHHLYVVFIIFFLLHAGAGHFYLVFSGVLLFALDKILRIIQSGRTTSLISARILPCKAVELTLPKDPCMQYTPTSTLFVKIPSISKFQWHPFSISSSSNMEDDRLSLIIKCHGPWTNSLYNKIQSIEDATSTDIKSLPIAVEGPYGPATFLCQRYDSMVLVAGGSGITPFLSLLQDAASRNGSVNNYCKKIQLIYAVKKSQDLSMLTPLSTLLLNQPSDLGHVRLRLFVTKEEGSRKSVEDMLYEMSQVKTIILNRGSSGNGVPQPEGFLLKATISGLASLVFLVALICLTHVFTHQGKRASKNKAPSWISDILVICSFVISISCSTMVATFLYMWRKPLKDYHASATSHNNVRSSQLNFERMQDVLRKHEINFGQRPNLEDILLELSSEEGESKVGVFVCGPDSMLESVASFCRKNSPKCSHKKQCFYTFHSINFSL